MPADFITTIDSDDEDEIPTQNGESSRARPAPAAGKTPKIDEDLNPEFEFDFDGSRNKEIDLWGGDEVKNSGKTDNEVSLLHENRGRKILM